ncbi:polysaccharide deacetylase family protein [Paenibacillus campi]|uniref:polysaccharide deacetylase family protein n=1 Tax=Paenibacillus campi TaxID=3106031 RepID=UPI002AFFC42B|nr:MULTISPECIES: polysaccharide deacetylase family protein [unclassified Paenibacillus]
MSFRRIRNMIIVMLYVAIAFVITFYVLSMKYPHASAFSYETCRATYNMTDDLFKTLNGEVPEDAANVAAASKSVHLKTAPAGKANHIAVLMYHYVVPQKYNIEPNNARINLEAFEAGMKYLHDEGYHTATLKELEQYVRGEIQLPEKTVVLTFDDGYQNNVIYAYPVLKKYGFKANIFIVGTKLSEQKQKFIPTAKTTISRPEMKATSDVFTYNSHTYNLHYKRLVQCAEYYAAGKDSTRFIHDIGLMKSKTGINTPYFAYPYGEYDPQMVYDLKRNGYRMAFTVRPGFVHPGDDPMYLPRLNVTSTTTIKHLLHLPDE